MDSAKIRVLTAPRIEKKRLLMEAKAGCEVGRQEASTEWTRYDRTDPLDSGKSQHSQAVRLLCYTGGGVSERMGVS